MQSLEHTLSYSFRDASLLSHALTHPSTAQVSHGQAFNNQRLEFLGDAVLGLCITEMLYAMYPGEAEGDDQLFLGAPSAREYVAGDRPKESPVAIVANDHGQVARRQRERVRHVTPLQPSSAGNSSGEPVQGAPVGGRGTERAEDRLERIVSGDDRRALFLQARVARGDTDERHVRSAVRARRGTPERAGSFP